VSNEGSQYKMHTPSIGEHINYITDALHIHMQILSVLW